jgi:hypothetical protein
MKFNYDGGDEMYEQPELPDWITDALNERDELVELRNEVEKLATYALTPTFVPAHALAKLQEIAAMCVRHRIDNTPTANA